MCLKPAVVSKRWNMGGLKKKELPSYFWQFQRWLNPTKTARHLFYSLESWRVNLHCSHAEMPTLEGPNAGGLPSLEGPNAGGKVKMLEVYIACYNFL